MAGKIVRGAIVGASTLLGKELAEELNRATSIVWDLLLLDKEDASGQITAAGEEALVIQPIRADAFAGIDVVFFAGEPSATLEFWSAARNADASIVDLTGALEGQPHVIVCSPLIQDSVVAPTLTTIAIVSAHPVAIMLASIYIRLQPLGLIRMAATVLLPASDLGAAGVDELHQQTVGLLSFKPLQKEIFDTQVAFNIVASLGDSAKLNMHALSARITAQIRALRDDSAADSITTQLLQVPVFHGYTASVYVEMASGAEESSVRKLLHGGLFQLDEEQPPSNESVAGKDEALMRITTAKSPQGSAFWLWLAADNLRLAARNAEACALELVKLRPGSGIQ